MSRFPDLLVSAVPEPDVIVVPGGIGTVGAMHDETLVDRLQQAAVGARWVTSVCSGSHILGAAGCSPAAALPATGGVREGQEPHAATPVSERFVIDGNVVTAAGVSAGLDLALCLAADLTRDDHAKTLRLFLEYDPHPPFDSGTVAKADPEIATRARHLLRGR